MDQARSGIRPRVPSVLSIARTIGAVLILVGLGLLLQLPDAVVGAVGIVGATWVLFDALEAAGLRQ